MSKYSNAELFELFWENSKLSTKNILEFKKRMDDFSGKDLQDKSLLFPKSDTMLLKARDSLAAIMAKRHSSRKFSNKQISQRKLGYLFSAFNTSRDGSRTFPSAGSTYALEVFALLLNVKGALNKKIVYYNHDNHSLSEIGEVKTYDYFADLLNIDLEGTSPAIIFIFAVDSDRTTEKYGERGGRFALIEAGQAIQNLSLRLAKEGIGGVEVGGILDNKMAELLGIENYPLKIVLGYACGFV